MDTVKLSWIAVNALTSAIINIIPLKASANSETYVCSKLLSTHPQLKIWQKRRTEDSNKLEEIGEKKKNTVIIRHENY